MPREACAKGGGHTTVFGTENTLSLVPHFIGKCCFGRLLRDKERGNPARTGRPSQLRRAGMQRDVNMMKAGGGGVFEPGTEVAKRGLLTSAGNPLKGPPRSPVSSGPPKGIPALASTM
ncbi:UNVERIFIED_CONTAM: hypothetical protein K2H54_001731 [Gekko kuhli]